MLRRTLTFWVLSWALSLAVGAQEPVRYRFTFPEPEHRWMEVEVWFRDLGSEPLELRMSRSSPGRYALHEFAKNVFDVHAFDDNGSELTLTRPDRHGWRVSGHRGSVRITYKIYGDRVDGTYLAIDPTHAHLNMPASLVWARGLELRLAELEFVPPEGAEWKAATQLYPGDGRTSFRAPNLQYLLDSPTELSDFSLRSFSVPADTGEGSTKAYTFKVAVHHQGTEEEVDAFAEDIHRIVLEERAIFGELPDFETETYTFIADYLPYASGDGMEHRNSTILTSSGSLSDESQRRRLLRTVAHEIFHAWNVERIRPESLEPFDFENANESGELWLAEGFTSYYGNLVLHRAELASRPDFLGALSSMIKTVLTSPGRRFRSVVEMSRLAPFVDAARSVDPTYWENTFISYYTWGAAIALGLDLTLRDRSNGEVTLDDYMRALWKDFGHSGEAVRPGRVATPYTRQDAMDVLGEVSGSPAFARDFFARYIEGREVVDYETLLARAGLVLRKKSPGRSSLGELTLDFEPGGATVSSAVPRGSPAYEAGIDRGDRLVSLDGTAISSSRDLERVLERHRPGDSLAMTFIRRGQLMTSSVVLAEDPQIEVVSSEELTNEEEAFRADWLSSKRPSP